MTEIFNFSFHRRFVNYNFNNTLNFDDGLIFLSILTFNLLDLVLISIAFFVNKLIKNSISFWQFSVLNRPFDKSYALKIKLLRAL